MSDGKMQLVHEQMQKCDDLAKQLYKETGILWKKLEEAGKSGHELEITDFNILLQLVKTTNVIQPVAAEYKFVLEKMMAKGFQLHGDKLAQRIKENILQMTIEKDSKIKPDNDNVVECSCPDCIAERDKVIDFAKAAAEKAIRELKDKK